ncbi:mannose-6-phosphate isomerase, class I [Anaerobranca gottschalkii]|uniref:mannose-6-phosphate isomerase n=1 Tax=Anaerobranca gottschalkii DSM 13577 TaxID=1120990 RepID=A0A1H9YHT9_9FIRM|nr:mannose-6-phosphate isomerase, class I [Anaerobranca gottschalkii]SES68589.1 mannose-6-phosphate isomerase, type 1 [Anaerobranca gottschalkii DSM 13577]
MNSEQFIFLNNVRHNKIWGFEDWVISAHPNGDCKIREGKYKDKTLSWLWENERHLFGNIEQDKFPLLVKEITTNLDLSVQVHPDDDYAKKHTNEKFGKTECWYILDCDKNSELILGHNAKSKDELREMIKKGYWQKLLKKVKVKPDDFYFIPAGTVHGIGKNIFILEIQQSSDITYRLYDYERLENGKPRKLHIEESIDVIKIPQMEQPIKQINKKFLPNVNIQYLVNDKHFSVVKFDVDGTTKIPNDKPFLLVSVIKGKGTINDERKITKGDHFIVLNQCKEFTVNGKLQLVISHI